MTPASCAVEVARTGGFFICCLTLTVHEPDQQRTFAADVQIESWRIASNLLWREFVTELTRLRVAWGCQSCSAQAEHPVIGGGATRTLPMATTGSPAFAGDDRI